MMKLRNYALLLAVSALSLQSCDNDDDESIVVPIELQNAFSGMYPTVNQVKWETKGQYYVADFINNSFDASAWYTVNGQWHMTETDISYSALPLKVKTTFETSEYSKNPWRRDDVDKLERQGTETIYVIEVENGNNETDLYYSEEGILVKTVVDMDHDDDSSDYLPSTQLPAAIADFIKQRYGEVSIMEVDMEDDKGDPNFGFIEVDIIHDGKVKEVLFDKKSVWVSTSWEVFTTSLPAEVKNTISVSYPGYRIDDADYFEKPNAITYYQIELESNNLPDKRVNILPNGDIYN